MVYSVIGSLGSSGDVVSHHNRIWDYYFFCFVGKLVLVAKWKLEVVWAMMPDVQGQPMCLFLIGFWENLQLLT